MSGRPEFSHLSPEDAARMVDVGSKPVTSRRAVAEAWVSVGAEVAAQLRDRGAVAKGNVLETARLAGIAAAKRTDELIPLCHPVPIDLIDLTVALEDDRVHLVAVAAAEAKTGVEMEAMTAVAVAALTVYDMVKSVARDVAIGPVRLLEKSGGRSGHYKRAEEASDADR